MQNSIQFFLKQQFGGEGERNRKIERSHWELRAEHCLSPALGEQEGAIEVRREKKNI